MLYKEPHLHLEPGPGTLALQELEYFMSDAEIEFEANLLDDIEASSTEFTTFLGSSGFERPPIRGDSESEEFSDIADLRKLMDAVQAATKQDILELLSVSTTFVINLQTYKSFCGENKLVIISFTPVFHLENTPLIQTSFC